MVLLSFIIPAYNCEQYILPCYKSISQCGLAQEEFEVIFINDESTDKTLEICTHLANKYANVHIINQSKGGPASARNKGLKLAIGEYIWFVDADDQIIENFVHTLMPYIKQGYDAVGFNYRKVYKSSVEPCISFHKQWQCNGFEYLEKKKHGLYLWDKIFKRNSITESFIDNTYHIEDFYFDYVNIIKMKKLICIPEIGYDYMQVKGDSISKKRDLDSISKANDDAFIVYQTLQVHLEKENNQKIRTLLQLIISHGVTGHLYTMMHESPVDMIQDYIAKYRKIGLYPVMKTDERKKNMFLYLANKEILFLLFLRIKRILSL